MTLTEFLLERIAEDEAMARGAGTYCWDELAFHDEARNDIPHIARHSPARVLAECEAKRLAIEAAWYAQVIHEQDYDSHTQERMSADNDNPDVLRHLSTVYAAHPDYRAEWAPEPA